MKISFFLTDYWWFGHATVLDSSGPYNAGFWQGCGFFAVKVYWKRRKR
jgi:hypothetical protein